MFIKYTIITILAFYIATQNVLATTNMNMDSAKEKAKMSGMDHTEIYTYLDLGLGYMAKEYGDSMGLSIKGIYAFNHNFGINIEMPMMYLYNPKDINMAGMETNKKQFMFEGVSIGTGGSLFRRDAIFGALYSALYVDIPSKEEDNIYTIRPMLIGAVYFDSFMVHPQLIYNQKVDEFSSVINNTSYLELSGKFMFFLGNKFMYSATPKVFINTNSSNITNAKSNNELLGFDFEIAYLANSKINIMIETSFTQPNNYDIAEKDIMIGFRTRPNASKMSMHSM